MSWFSIGADLTNSLPTAITAHASANTKGTAVELEDSTPSAATFMVVHLAPTSGGPGFMVDIVTGASLNVVIAANLYNRNLTTPHQMASIGIPCNIPAGTRVGAQCQSTSGGAQMYVVIELFNPPRLMADGITAGAGDSVIYAPGGTVTTYGATTASTTPLTIDPGAAANTKGAYTAITASTTDVIKGFFLTTGMPTSDFRSYYYTFLDIATGAEGAESVVVPNIALCNCNNRLWPGTSYYPIYPPIAAGTRLAARCQCNSATTPGRELGLVFHGVS